MLYFVRVPGSRDLFLTSMHPLKSTVTAQDVEGCLYYVHVQHEGQGNGYGGGGLGVGVRPPLLSTGSSGSGSGRKKWSAQNILSHAKKGSEDLRDFSMTVIRRDPATGAQWNVAHLTSTGGLREFAPDGRTPAPPPPIIISLPGNGYKKFMPLSSQGSVPRQPATQFQHPPLPRPPQPPHGQPGRGITPEEEEAYFRRKREYQDLLVARDRQIQQLELEHAEHEQALAMAEQDRGLVRQVAWDCAAPGAGDKWWKRGVSKTKKHLRSTSSSGGHGGYIGEGPGEKEKKDKDHWKGYAFDALWGPLGNAGRGERGGTCRFKEAAGGKIMKCKYYPGNGGESYLVSAVEFKLPSLAGFHRARTPSPVGGGEGMGEGEGEELPDWGKAKMGTFVVHNAGMEMLDLVVSANVGMFWRKWEGWVGERGALGQ